MKTKTHVFTDLAKAVHTRFIEMSRGELFVTRAENIFDKYLAAFPPGSNPMFRTRTEHDCNTCKQFVRRLGVCVSIKGGKLTTLWGDLGLEGPFGEVADRMDSYVRSLGIEGVFRTKERAYGADHNYDKDRHKYEHFYGQIADKHYARDPEAKRGEQAAIFQVFKRGLEEIRESDLSEVLDLIDQNALYRGEEHKPALLGFRGVLRDYKAGGSSELFVWENLSNRNARFRNTVIGTLLTDLSEGKDIEAAVKSFEQKVAPANYKRPTTLITQGMVEKAVETLNTLGLGGAIYRRYARLSDVSVNDVLFVDNESKSKMKDGIAALLETSVKKPSYDPKQAVLMSAEEFVRDVLPKAKSLGLLLENRHSGNFVSLTGSDGPERLFKWDNNFAWSYDGDTTDSVKQRVKAAGGNIHADLRVSLSWYNYDDLDLHSESPYGHVFFANKQGILDVDMNAGGPTSKTPVENQSINKPRDGRYIFKVNQYRRRETTDCGFAIEVENAGVLRTFSYAKAMRDNETIHCFDLLVKQGRVVEVKSSLTEGSSSQEKWGVKTETLVPVSLVCYSPNHWGDQRVGAKHLIFALRDCKNPDPTRGIYNEFLNSRLDPHRKVFEVLGSKTKCPFSDEQISGLGFTAARGDSVVVVTDGKRSYNLQF